MSAYAVQVQSLSYAFNGKKVLADVSFSVPEGVLVAVAGPNGAGKTTLFRCLMGFYRPRRGSVRLFGHPPWRFSRLPRLASYAAESGELPAAWSLAELTSWLQLAGSYTREQAEQLLEQARSFGLQTAKPLGSFSRGQRSLAQLLVALGREPDLLLLDEPTLGLDVAARQQVLDTLLAFLAHKPATVVLATQDLELVERLAEEVVWLYQGQCQWAGSLAAFKGQYAVLEGVAQVPEEAAQVLSYQQLVTGNTLLVRIQHPQAWQSWLAGQGLVPRQPALPELAQVLWQPKEAENA